MHLTILLFNITLILILNRLTFFLFNLLRPRLPNLRLYLFPNKPVLGLLDHLSYFYNLK